MADISRYPTVTSYSPSDQLITYQTSSGQLVKIPISVFSEALAQTFTALTDTPGTYLGQVGKTLAVNAAEDGLEFVANTLSPTFQTLPDTFTYAGEGLKRARVNAGETALEAADMTFLESVDVPNSYAGLAGSLLRVNAGETGLEFFPDTGEIPNVVLVNEESDLPAVNGSGEHELDAGVAYWFVTSFTLANPIRFISDDTVVFGNDSANTVINYTGTGYAVRATTGASIRMRYMEFISANDGIQYAGGAGSGSSDNISLERVQIICSTGNALSVDNVNNILAEFCTFSGSDPVNLSGATCGTFSFVNSVILTLAATTGLDYGTSIWTSINILGGTIVGIPGSTGISGAVSNGNLTATANARVTNLQFSGVTTLLSGISTTDTQWRFGSNVGIAESQTVAFAYITASANTVVSAINTDYPVNGTWAAQAETERATVATNGEITFQNIEEEKGLINVTFVASKIGGGTQNFEFKVQKDAGGLGSWVDVTAVTKTVALTSATSSITMFGVAKYKEADKFRLVVRNTSGTDDLIVTVTQFVIG